MSQVQDVAGAVLAGSVSETDSNARKAMWGSAIGYAMDGFDLLILGFMLNAISGDLHLTSVQAASLVTATLVGAVVGGFGFGMLSDRLGRVRVLTWTIVVFAVFTGMCALAQGYWDLLVYRGIAGLGLGGEFGIGMALVAEAWPSSKRARACSYVGLGWQFGVLAAALADAAAAAGDRLARHVCGRHFPGGRELLHPKRPARAGVVRLAQEPRAGCTVAAAIAGRRRADDQDQSRDDHPLLGAEFRLLRHHDLAAELSVDAVRLWSDQVRDLDLGDDRRHGAWYLPVRTHRGPHRPPSGLPRLHARCGRSWSWSIRSSSIPCICWSAAPSWASSSTACWAVTAR